MNKQNNLKKEPNSNMEGEISILIKTLKSIDEKNLKTLKRFRIVFSFLLFFYLVLIVIHPVTNLIVIASGLIVFLLVFIYSYNKTLKKDYSLPLRELLIKTRKSYRLISPEYCIVNLAAIAILYSSMESVFTSYLKNSFHGVNENFLIMLLVLVIYVPSLVVAYFVWRAKYQKVIRQIDSCIKEFDE
jgi:hypothetical protein